MLRRISLSAEGETELCRNAWRTREWLTLTGEWRSL